MIVEAALLIAFTLIGTLLGMTTGLIPGLHVNNLALLLLSATPGLLAAMSVLASYGISEGFILVLLAATIFAISIAHTFLDFIPGTFLGAPDGEVALSVLPAHQFLLEGKGYQAVRLSALGSFGAVLFALALLVPYRLVIGAPLHGYQILKHIVVYILVAVVFLLIMTETRRIPYKIGFRPAERGCGSDAGEDDESQENDSAVETGAPLSRIAALERDEPATIAGEVVSISKRGCTVRDESGAVYVAAQPSKLGIDLGHEPSEEQRPLRVALTGTLERVEGRWSLALGRLAALGLFALAGTFGLAVLDLPVESPVGFPPSVLFPALAGLFGIASLLISLFETPSIPPQSLEHEPIERKAALASIGSGGFFGSIVGFLPGMSGAIATIFAMLGRRDPDDGQVIVTLSAVNTANAFFVLVALFLILRPRSGAAIVIDELVTVEQWSGALMPQALVYLMISGLLAAALAYFLTLFWGRVFATGFGKIPYKGLVSIILGSILIMVVLFTGALGLLILAVSTAIGFIAPKVGLRRSHAMGVLLLPVIVMLAG